MFMDFKQQDFTYVHIRISCNYIFDNNMIVVVCNTLDLLYRIGIEMHYTMLKYHQPNFKQ